MFIHLLVHSQYAYAYRTCSRCLRFFFAFILFFDHVCVAKLLSLISQGASRIAKPLKCARTHQNKQQITNFSAKSFQIFVGDNLPHSQLGTSNYNYFPCSGFSFPHNHFSLVLWITRFFFRCIQIYVKYLTANEVDGNRSGVDEQRLISMSEDNLFDYG